MNGRKLIEFRQYEDYFILAAGLIIALLLRFSLLSFESGDLRAFVGPWYDFIVANGGFAALRYEFANYTPLYLYMITIAAALFSGVPKFFAIKFISIIFDFICAAFVYKLVRLPYQTGPAPLFACFVMLFAPTVLLNSSFWGQADIIYTTGLVACLYFLAVRRQIAAFIAFSLAFAFKLQAILLAPFLLILLLKQRISWKSFLIIPAVYLLTILPAWLAGRPLLDLLTIYLGQVDYYQVLSMNAPNLYQWLPNNLYHIFYPAGLFWTAAIVFLFAATVYKSQVRLTPGVMIQLATFSALIVVYFLPKMHDRYFFAADILSIIYAFYFPQYFFIPIVIGLVSFFSYFPFLFGVEIIPLSWLALVLLLIIIILARHLALTLWAREAEI